MKMKFLSLITFAFLTAGFSGHASAEEVIVKKGDTLWDIAERNNVEVENIIHLNNLQGDVIHPEDTLQLHRSHKVQPGETLWDIAKEYKVEVDELKNWNEVDSSIIQPEDELIIKETKVEIKSENVSISNKKTNDKKEEKTSEKTNKILTVTATAYTASCEGCSGTTKTGVNLKANPNQKVIAVDPNVIPLGSTVHVEGYGTAIAADVGGAIKGNKIDVFIPTKSEAIKWGRKTVEVKILN